MLGLLKKHPAGLVTHLLHCITLQLSVHSGAPSTLTINSNLQNRRYAYVKNNSRMDNVSWLATFSACDYEGGM